MHQSSHSEAVTQGPQRWLWHLPRSEPQGLAPVRCLSRPRMQCRNPSLPEEGGLEPPPRTCPRPAPREAAFNLSQPWTHRASALGPIGWDHAHAVPEAVVADDHSGGFSTHLSSISPEARGPQPRCSLWRGHLSPSSSACWPQPSPRWLCHTSVCTWPFLSPGGEPVLLPCDRLFVTSAEALGPNKAPF